MTNQDTNHEDQDLFETIERDLDAIEDINTETLNEMDQADLESLEEIESTEKLLDDIDADSQAIDDLLKSEPED